MINDITKVSFELDKKLHAQIKKNGKDNGRNVSAEIRFQIIKLYEREK